MLKAIYRNKKLLIGIIMVAIVVFIGIFANQIMPYEYDATYVGPINSEPSSEHWFGTDLLGRDVFSRVIYGTRISLIAAFAITILSLIIGVPIGLLSAYYGGIVDNILQRLVDITFSFPWVLIGLLVAVIRGPSLTSVIIALAITYSPQIIRITRGAALVVKQQDFISAVKLTGEKDLSIIFRFILPNCFAPIIIYSSLIMSFSILGEAGLSYIGYGVRPPLSSWGMMLQEATEYLWTARYLIIFPGIFIVFSVLAFNFVGDGLRDILDPRYKRIYGR